MPKSGVPDVRRGPGPAALLLIVGCAMAIALNRGPADSGPSSGRGVRARSAVPATERLSLPPGAVDADGVQRRLGGHAGAVDADGVQRRLGGHTGAVALTFDDGPDPRWTPAVLDLLRRYRVRATFCLVGEHVVAHPELVRRIAADGHALCDHTWSHDEALPNRSLGTIRAEMSRTYDAILAASGGVRPRYYRAPAGRWSPVVVAEAHRLGLRPLGWSVDPADWRRPPAALITQRVLDAAAPGTIVLLHDGYGDRARTVAALRDIVPSLEARHLTTATP